MRRTTYVAVAGAATLAASLWLPWFTRRVPDLFTPLFADRTFSGWAVLDELGFVPLAAAGLVAVWAVRRLPAVALVASGALTLLVEVAVTVERLGGTGEAVSTTSPAAGLLLAYAGATTILLVGLACLMGDVSRRAEAARATK